MEHVGADNWLAVWRSDDNVASDGFLTKIEEAESVRKLFDTSIGHLKMNGADRLDSQVIGHILRYPSPCRACVHQEGDFLLPLWVVYISHGKF